MPDELAFMILVLPGSDGSKDHLRDYLVHGVWFIRDSENIVCSLQIFSYVSNL